MSDREGIKWGMLDGGRILARVKGDSSGFIKSRNKEVKEK